MNNTSNRSTVGKAAHVSRRRFLYSGLSGLAGLSLPAAFSPAGFAFETGNTGRHLIVDKIEDEATVVEVLEMDVAYGQGHLFGEPRPVRDDMLETTPRDGGSNVIQMSA